MEKVLVVDEDGKERGYESIEKVHSFSTMRLHASVMLIYYNNKTKTIGVKKNSFNNNYFPLHYDFYLHKHVGISFDKTLEEISNKYNLQRYYITEFIYFSPYNEIIEKEYSKVILCFDKFPNNAVKVKINTNNEPLTPRLKSFIMFHLPNLVEDFDL